MWGGLTAASSSYWDSHEVPYAGSRRLGLLWKVKTLLDMLDCENNCGQIVLNDLFESHSPSLVPVLHKVTWFGLAGHEHELTKHVVAVTNPSSGLMGNGQLVNSFLQLLDMSMSSSPSLRANRPCEP